MITTKIICWNCSGISAGDTSSRVLRLIRTHKPVVVCLVETRANFDRVDRFYRKISKNWDWATILSDGFLGGIFVLWHRSIGIITPIAVSKRFWNQCFLWNELSKLSSLQIPWLVAGDFNAILQTEQVFIAYYDWKAQFFLDFIVGNNLIDLKYSGPHFTWCNNQSGLAQRWVRLDRYLVNLAWANSFKINNLKHLPALSLIMLRFFFFLPLFILTLNMFFALIIAGLTFWVVIMQFVKPGIIILKVTPCIPFPISCLVLVLTSVSGVGMGLTRLNLIWWILRPKLVILKTHILIWFLNLFLRIIILIFPIFPPCSTSVIPNGLNVHA